MTDPLQFFEDRIRQKPAFPANPQPSIREVVDLDHFPAQAKPWTLTLERQLHLVVVHHQLMRDLALLARAQDIIEILTATARIRERP